MDYSILLDKLEYLLVGLFTTYGGLALVALHGVMLLRWRLMSEVSLPGYACCFK